MQHGSAIYIKGLQKEQVEKQGKHEFGDVAANWENCMAQRCEEGDIQSDKTALGIWIGGRINTLINFQ